MGGLSGRDENGKGYFFQNGLKGLVLQSIQQYNKGLRECFIKKPQLIPKKMNDSRFLCNQLDAELINKVTSQFYEILLEVQKDDVEKVKKEFNAIHQNRHSALVLELLLAKSRVDSETKSRMINVLHAIDEEADEIVADLNKLRDDMAERLVYQLIERVEYLSQKPKDIARK